MRRLFATPGLALTPVLALMLAACALAIPSGAPAISRSTASATASPPDRPVARASLPEIEAQAMCVTCKIPLNEAESPQADRERAFIRGLIEQGRDEAQIKDALVEQYGPTVLALPRAHGFNVAVYAVPAAVVLALLVLLALLLPSWRKRARARERVSKPAPQLSEQDAERLDADLARFD